MTEYERIQTHFPSKHMQTITEHIDNLPSMKLKSKWQQGHDFNRV